MCYSAQIQQDYRKYTKLYGADIGIDDFVRLYWQRQGEHIDAWLNPDPANLAAQYAILADRERPYYEHRLAA